MPLNCGALVYVAIGSGDWIERKLKGDWAEKLGGLVRKCCGPLPFALAASVAPDLRLEGMHLDRAGFSGGRSTFGRS